MTDAGSRRDELAANLQRVRERIVRACAAAGRDPAEVTLVTVTKTWPAADVATLAELGVGDVGESRDQEAAAKVAEARALGATGLRWHFVGQLQTNKCRSVAGYADVVHGLDRPRLISALDGAAERVGRALDCLVQVNLDPEPDRARGGVAPQRVPELAEAVTGARWLRLRGVMAVAPRGRSPRRAFERLALVAERVRHDHPDARWISAGMSADFDDAVRIGATHLRVGSAVLGSRPPLG